MGIFRHLLNGFAVSVDVLDGNLEGVSVLQLQRPDARNALGRQLITELVQCLETIRQEKSTRVLLIKSSVVGVFSAGADLKVCMHFQNVCSVVHCTVALVYNALSVIQQPEFRSGLQ